MLYLYEDVKTDQFMEDQMKTALLCYCSDGCCNEKCASHGNGSIMMKSNGLLSKQVKLTNNRNLTHSGLGFYKCYLVDTMSFFFFFLDKCIFLQKQLVHLDIFRSRLKACEQFCSHTACTHDAPLFSGMKAKLVTYVSRRT